MGRLQDKVAIITGAGSGIGQATSLRFAAEGAKIAVADLNPASAAQTVAMITEKGGTAIAITADVGVEAQIKAMIDDTIAAFGRIDILYNNALNLRHTQSQAENDFFAFDTAVFEDIVRVNVLGGVHASKFAIPHMIKQGGGSIIFTSSTSAMGGDVAQYSYGASKAMVNWYVKTIATSFGKKGVRCNAILPGPTLTKSMKEWINPEMEAAFLNILNSPRLGLPEDIANLALFLASDESKFVNGGLYVADGGMTAPLHFVQLQRDHFLPKE